MSHRRIITVYVETPDLPTFEDAITILETTLPYVLDNVIVLSGVPCGYCNGPHSGPCPMQVRDERVATLTEELVAARQEVRGRAVDAEDTAFTVVGVEDGTRFADHVEAPNPREAVSDVRYLRPNAEVWGVFEGWIWAVA